MGTYGSLEGYLRTAQVLHGWLLEGGGGHSDKQTLCLYGGVAVASKPGDDGGTMTLQARREVAASLMSTELQLDFLVPMTVLREVPRESRDDTAEGSAQVMWPNFKEALRAGVTPEQCPEETAWPIAVFDSLIINTDRKGDNWGIIDSNLELAVLIDHGHAFDDSHPASNSPFVARFRNSSTSVPPELIERVQSFRDQADTSRMWEFLPDAAMRKVIERADLLLANQQLP